MPPSAYRQWVLSHPSDESYKDFSSLSIKNTHSPTVGPTSVLIKIHAVSLNFRDIMIATNTYLWPICGQVVPCSDAAGEIVATGSNVTRFNRGDRVMPIFHSSHLSGDIRPSHVKTALGAQVDGVLREYAVFDEQSLVAVPEHMSYEEASCLPCAGATAWNALMCGGRQMQPGDYVVTQGTGGVSMFATQLGVATGASVISTTSSAEKAEVLKSLGVKNVINYRETPEWGVKAKQLSPAGEGVDYVLEIGGPETMEQSLKACRMYGHIAVIGQRSSQDINNEKGATDISLTQAFKYVVNLRRLMVPPRDQFEQMNRAISVNKIRPVVDKRIFQFEEAKEALQYLSDGKHIGNVVIKVSQ